MNQSAAAGGSGANQGSLANPSQSPGFAMLPRYLAELLQRDELSFDQFALLAYLLAVSNYRTQTYSRTLRGLHDEMCWRKSESQLGKVLQELRDLGFIAYESKRGQRKPYLIRLMPQLLDSGVRLK